MSGLILFWLVCAVAGGIIGDRKGSAVSGFFLGALLGPLGLLVIAVAKGDRNPCPFCRELVQSGAVVCPHCQRDLPKSALPVDTGPPPQPVKPATKYVTAVVLFAVAAFIAWAVSR